MMNLLFSLIEFFIENFTSKEMKGFFIYRFTFYNAGHCFLIEFSREVLFKRYQLYK